MKKTLTSGPNNAADVVWGRFAHCRPPPTAYFRCYKLVKKHSPKPRTQMTMDFVWAYFLPDTVSQSVEETCNVASLQPQDFCHWIVGRWWLDG
jgi:hypothetical protein